MADGGDGTANDEVMEMGIFSLPGRKENLLAKARGERDVRPDGRISKDDFSGIFNSNGEIGSTLRCFRV